MLLLRKSHVCVWVYLKEGNPNKTKQKEVEIDFERFRKRAVK